MAKPKNLQNHFLVTMPHLTESVFGKGIIYLCEHNKDGYMGLIINKPVSKKNVGEILKQMDTLSLKRFSNICSLI